MRLKNGPERPLERVTSELRRKGLRGSWQPQDLGDPSSGTRACLGQSFGARTSTELRKEDKRQGGWTWVMGGRVGGTMTRETEGTSHCWACWDLGFKPMGNSCCTWRSHGVERSVALSSSHDGRYLSIDISILRKGGIIGKKVTLPAVFKPQIRPDVVNFVHSNSRKSSRQPYAVSELAGHRSSTEFSGYWQRCGSNSPSSGPWDSQFWLGGLWKCVL